MCSWSTRPYLRKHTNNSSVFLHSPHTCLQMSQINTSLCLLLISSPSCIPSTLFSCIFSCYLKLMLHLAYSISSHILNSWLNTLQRLRMNYRHLVRLTLRTNTFGSKKIISFVLEKITPDTLQQAEISMMLSVAHYIIEAQQFCDFACQRQMKLFNEMSLKTDWHLQPETVPKSTPTHWATATSRSHIQHHQCRSPSCHEPTQLQEGSGGGNAARAPIPWGFLPLSPCSHTNAWVRNGTNRHDHHAPCPRQGLRKLLLVETNPTSRQPAPCPSGPSPPLQGRLWLLLGALGQHSPTQTPTTQHPSPHATCCSPCSLTFQPQVSHLLPNLTKFMP